MLEFTNDLLGLLLSAGLVLLIAAVVLLAVLLTRQGRHREQTAGEIAREGRMQEDALRALPSREEIYQRFHGQSDEIIRAMNDLSHADAQRIDALGARLDSFGAAQDVRLNFITRSVEEKLTLNEQRIERMRTTLESSVGKLQQDNAQKLDEMRRTVDEKLHATLDKRLGESFSLVNERLEQVYKGLGEMQSLANGVGDLKRVLTNVKTRGVWGEMQLGAILEQVLSPGQYEENVQVVPGTNQRVEYAVRLPGQGQGTVFLPIDSKFPIESYERLLAAGENGDPAQVQSAQAALEAALKVEARRIASKYISPPSTTDFAVMFLPIEGLYAEALRCRGLAEEVQERLRVVIAGPTTLTALLTSLQVGFRTLAIEKRSGEVWQLLGAVKTEFSRFSDLLDATQKKMHAVSESIEKATKKTRTIERKLRQVQGLDDVQAAKLLEGEDAESLPALGEDE